MIIHDNISISPSEFLDKCSLIELKEIELLLKNEKFSYLLEKPLLDFSFLKNCDFDLMFSSDLDEAHKLAHEILLNTTLKKMEIPPLMRYFQKLERIRIRKVVLFNEFQLNVSLKNKTF